MSKLFNRKSGNQFELSDDNQSSNSVKKLVSALHESYKSHDEKEKEIELLFESPMKFSGFKFDVNDSSYNYALCKKIKEKGTHIGKFKKYEIYEIETNGEITDIFTGGDLIMVMFVFVIKNNIMFEKVVWQHITNFGACRDILFNYYLQLYNSVISDELHSSNGEKYWKKLLPQALKDGYNIYAINIKTNESQPLKLDDIDKFYGYTIQSQDYRFLITKK